MIFLLLLINTKWYLLQCEEKNQIEKSVGKMSPEYILFAVQSWAFLYEQDLVLYVESITIIISVIIQ